MIRTWRRQRLRDPRVGAHLAFARVATALADRGTGAAAVGALAVGVVAVKRFALDAGRIRR